jgi:hypothetical protein
MSDDEEIEYVTEAAKKHVEQYGISPAVRVFIPFGEMDDYLPEPDEERVDLSNELARVATVHFDRRGLITRIEIPPRPKHAQL